MRESLAAACSMSPWTAAMPELEPIMRSSMKMLFFRDLFSFRRSSMARAFRTTVMVLSRESGFSRKSKAPIFVAWTAREMLACPEIMITSTSGYCSRTRFRTSIPPMLGSHTSRNTRSTGFAASSARPWIPSSASITEYPSSWRMSRSTVRMPGLIIDDEDRAHAETPAVVGMSMKMVVPLEPSLSAHTFPLWSNTMRCTMARPSPVPSFFVVK